MKSKARAIAYYLPQFHPIPENDEWWGKGFTEWTNVAKAKPLFKGHWQPRLPADLGYYDLRLAEARAAQADLAKEYGVEGFCYYHYWFGNERMLLEKPFNEVLASKEPDLPFCLCWANATWTGIWYGETNRTLIEQVYGGKKDYEKHFDYLMKAFTDDRYIKVDDKPLFQILIPRYLPQADRITDTFREMAHQRGLKGLFLVAGYSHPNDWVPAEHGFDAVVSSRFQSALGEKSLRKQRFFNRLLNNKWVQDNQTVRDLLKSKVTVIDYKDLINHMKITEDYTFDHYPCVVPNWDNTPRSGSRGIVVANSTPELFKTHFAESVDFVQGYSPEHRIIFIKSWNEWAEGNYLEPDTKYGLSYLKVIKDCLTTQADCF